MSIQIIVATDLHSGIGLNNQLLWHLPDDLKHFKALTLGKTVVMGRKTFESIGKALPRRRNIILSRNAHFEAPGCDIFQTIEDVLAEEGSEDYCIIGGGKIYEQFLPMTDDLWLTKVNVQLEADTFFPEIKSEEWQEISREAHEQDEKHAYAFEFIHYKRR